MSKNTQSSVKNTEVKNITTAMSKISDKYPDALPLCTEYIQLAKRIRHHATKETTKATAIKRMIEIKVQIAAIQHPTAQPVVTPTTEPVKVKVEVKKTHTFGYQEKTGIQYSTEETIIYTLRKAYEIADKYPVKAQQMARSAISNFVDKLVVPVTKSEKLELVMAKKQEAIELFTDNGFEKRNVTLKAAIADYGKKITPAIEKKALESAAFRAIEQAQKSFEKEQVTSS